MKPSTLGVYDLCSGGSTLLLPNALLNMHFPELLLYRYLLVTKITPETIASIPLVTIRSHPQKGCRSFEDTSRDLLVQWLSAESQGENDL